MNRWGIPRTLERKIRDRDRFCIYCGIEMVERVRPGQSRKTLATWEHIINDASIVTLENIALCCAPCNSSKGARNLAVWMQSKYCEENEIDESTVSEVVREALRRNSS